MFSKHQKPHISKEKPKISVIIPAYNEEDRLGQTITETTLFFTTKPYTTEIIVVDDGSSDQTTRLIMKHFNDREMKKLKNIRAYLKRHPQNKGKGRAVATGIAAASGSHILIIDADGATPISEFEKLHREIGTFPFVIGSRDIGIEERTLQGALRKLIGKSARLITKILFNLPITDTQCGFKLIESRLAKDLARDQFTDRFGFDVEYLVKAHKRSVPVKEVGVRWHDKTGGKVHVVKDSFRTLKELVKIRNKL